MKRPGLAGTALLGILGVAILQSSPDRQGFPHETHDGLFPTCVGCHRGALTGGEPLYTVEPATCAGCHTAQVEYKGTGIRIEGGGTLADTMAFMSGLGASMRATVDDGAKFERFARKVLGSGYSPDAEEKLRQALADRTGYVQEWVDRNSPPHPWGFARIEGPRRDAECLLRLEQLVMHEGWRGSGDKGEEQWQETHQHPSRMKREISSGRENTTCARSPCMPCPTMTGDPGRGPLALESVLKRRLNSQTLLSLPSAVRTV